VVVVTLMAGALRVGFGVRNLSWSFWCAFCFEFWKRELAVILVALVVGSLRVSFGDERSRSSCK
jgi:hypothetical protein